jgi:hypothetical protein
VSAAKERVAREIALARREMEATAGQLSAEIARRVLESASRPSPREAQ